MRIILNKWTAAQAAVNTLDNATAQHTANVLSAMLSSSDIIKAAAALEQEQVLVFSLN